MEERRTTSNVSPLRFVGLDVHQHDVVLGAVNAQQVIVWRPHRLSLGDFALWCHQKLQSIDAVALKATSNAWTLCDPWVGRAACVVVAHPLQLKWVAATRVKTDLHNSLQRARWLAVGLIPTVWVPPPPVRALRALVSHRQRLSGQRTPARHRLQSVLQCHHVAPPNGDLVAVAQRSWWESLPIDPAEQLLLRQDLLLDRLAPLIDQVEAALYQAGVCEPWPDHVPFLVHRTGGGVLTARMMLAAADRDKPLIDGLWRANGSPPPQLSPSAGSPAAGKGTTTGRCKDSRGIVRVFSRSSLRSVAVIRLQRLRNIGHGFWTSLPADTTPGQAPDWWQGAAPSAVRLSDTLSAFNNPLRINTGGPPLKL